VHKILLQICNGQFFFELHRSLAPIGESLKQNCGLRFSSSMIILDGEEAEFVGGMEWFFHVDG
jgi:hypothetical protein